MTRRVRRVAVVGRNAAAWLSALAIHRSLGASGVQVEVVELPTRLSEADVYATLPSISALHGLLGIDEEIILRACRGVPIAAQRFANWSGGAPAFFLPYDDEPPPGGELPFIHYWLKARKAGLRVALEDFSLGAMAAKAGKIPTIGEPALGLSAGYGLDLDARAYSGLAKHLSGRSGIQVTSSPISSVMVEADRITAVEISDGRRIEADLFIDASGEERALIGRMPGAEFESWDEWLFCDRMIAASAPRLNSLPAFSHIAAFRGGWVALRPLQDRTAVTAVYSSRAVSDNEVAQQMPVLARMPLGGDAVLSTLRQGAQKKPWIGNCVAIGESAISLEPLDAGVLHIVHGCLTHLMTLFPVTAEAFPEAEAYNRVMGRFGANLRDFEILHYRLNRRFDEAHWDAIRDVPPPETLARKLDLFAARGDVPLYDDETFQARSWMASMLGHGLMPESYDPRIDSIPEESQIALVQQQLRDVAELVRKMPSVDEFVGSICRVEAAAS